jgi:hypothetical protein
MCLHRWQQTPLSGAKNTDKFKKPRQTTRFFFVLIRFYANP